MWPGRINKDQLFYATTLIVLAIIFYYQSADACYQKQYCLTPLNYSGRYVEDEIYGYMSDEAKTLCDGFCHHNSTLRLRCCAYDAKVKLERISEQVCTYNHLLRRFIIHGVLVKDNEFPFMVGMRLVCAEGVIKWWSCEIISLEHIFKQ
nr:uncharacterized protein LOC106625721 [Bactrocera oleae]